MLRDAERPTVESETSLVMTLASYGSASFQFQDRHFYWLLATFATLLGNADRSGAVKGAPIIPPRRELSRHGDEADPARPFDPVTSNRAASAR
jgi:hypothetical protein